MTARASATHIPLTVCGLVIGMLLMVVAPARAADSVLTPSPTSWDFGNGDIHGNPSSPQMFTFTNNTASNVNVSSVGVVGTDATEFPSSSDNCSGGTVNPGSSCGIQVAFAPTSVGSAAARLELTDDTGTLDIALSGTGITGTLSATPNPVVFNSQPYYQDGGQSVGVTIQDSGNAGTQATAATITGPDASQFNIAWGSNCGTQLYFANNSCGMGVGLNQLSGPGTFHAELEITSDSQSSPLIIPIQATALSGPDPVVSPSGGVDFGNVAIGQSAAQTFKVTNAGDWTLQIQGSFIVSGQAYTLTADGCDGQQLAPGSSCQMTAAFQPTAAGYREGTLIVITNSQRNVSPVGFSGTGVAPLHGAAVITGAASAGSALTCQAVGYPAGTGLQYQWLVNGRLMAGGNTPTFVPLDANVGQRISCRVNSSNPVSSQTVNSPATAPIAPMLLSRVPGAFSDQQTCRLVQMARALNVGGRTVSARYGQPMTPWTPLTLSSTAAVSVSIDSQRVGQGRSVTLTPRALAGFADGAHRLTATAGRASQPASLLLGPCQLAVRLAGGPHRVVSLSASSRYGLHKLTFQLPAGLRLNARKERDLGQASFNSAGYPTSVFDLIGANTGWNGVRVKLTRNTITVTGLPIQTGVVTITLRRGVVTGRAGRLIATATERGSQATRRAGSPAIWYP